MSFYRAHKIKLYPTEEQKTKFVQQAGLARFVYNWAIDQNKKDYQEYKEGKREKTDGNILCSEFAAYKKSEAPVWVSDVISCVYIRTIRDCYSAFIKFYRKKAEYPKYHKKGHKDSFYISNDKGKLKDKKFYCPKIGWIKLSENPLYIGKIMSYTVLRDKDDWFVSVHYELEEDPRPVCSNPESVVGVDVGIKNNITLSTGEQYNIRDTKKLEKKLKYQNRCLSRTKTQSKNHMKRLSKLRRTYKRLQNQVKDDIHKATTAICKNHGIVVVETLSIDDMKKNASGRKMRHNIAGAHMHEIQEQFRYKAQKYHKVNMYFPSSQLCSSCGHKQKMPLSQRTYVCSECGMTLDRDINAAKNLRKQYILSGVGNPVVS